MLWPFILPFQITVALMIALGICLFWFGWRREWKPAKSTIVALCLPILLFVPSCIATSYAVDNLRFGTFHYDDFGAIRDFRVERYMPPPATDITVFKQYGGNGYRARFTVSQEDFEAWHSEFWARHGEQSNRPRPSNDGQTASDPDDFKQWCGKFNRSLPSDSVKYQSPVAGNGAHYTIDYSPSTKLAFLRSCYW
ncbi:MAG: hypothetical protein AB8G99_23545 [Planctomycetaceae bacterium]